MDAGFEKFKRQIYIHALAIILEKLHIPFKFNDSLNLEFDLYFTEDPHVDTTELSIKEIDNLIEFILNN